MKLRNKKTGEIGVINLKIYGDDAEYVYDTIETLYKEWEDNIPKEPLIKDPKIRKAVRAWAEVNDIERVKYSYDGNCLWYGDDEIGFKYLEPLALALNVYYTIKELCGEEEE